MKTSSFLRAPPHITSSVREDSRNVLIAANADDDHAQFMLQVLQERGIDARCVDPAIATKVNELQISIDPGEPVTLAGRPVNAGTTIWWRRVRSPVIDEQITDPRMRQFALRQWDMALSSAIELSAARFVNDPRFERRAVLKPLQLRAATSCGLPIPQTLITNQADHAEKFITELANSGRRCVFKSLAPGGYHFGETRIISSVTMYSEELGLAPVIFQECIERGQDVRVTIFGTKNYAAHVKTPSDETLIDWRIDPLSTYVPCTLGGELIEKLHAVLSAIGLVTGTFDLRIDRSGNPYFFEVNPSGQFLYMVRYGYPEIAKEFGNFLCDQPT